MFIAYEVALDAVRCLRPIADRIALHSAAEAAQLRDAAGSIVRNLAEGRRRRGRDRTHLFRVAAGSAAECLASIDVAVAWGWLDAPFVAEARAHLDRELGLLWPLTK